MVQLNWYQNLASLEVWARGGKGVGNVQRGGGMEIILNVLKLVR